ncbi:MAG: nickel-responsive transcriptional regulator NikR [Fretibacterium sp.]|nr:nickel-responsive transcriptional regulator NikR [Fretibacterium sp.]
MKTKKAEKLARFSITMPDSLLQEFDRRARDGGKTNRSEAFRILMRRYIAEEQWRTAAEAGQKEGEVYGTVTLVYDHHLPNLTRKLTGAQHDHGEVILCTTHVHVDHDTCLECIVMRGTPAKVQNFLEALKGIRGIKSLERVIVQGA